MKILCLIEDLGPGGAQRQLVNLGIELQRRGHQLMFFYFIDNDFYKPVLREAGIEVKREILRRPMERILTVRRFIREGRFDAVISFLSTANLVSTLATLPLKSWKVILGERSANPVILKSAKSRIVRFFHPLADYVVANSNANMQMVRKVNPFLRDSSCKIIYNMIDLDIWSPVEGFEFRKNGQLKICVAASHRKLKNLKGLLTALCCLNEKERSQLHIEWYGDRMVPPYFDSSYEDAVKFIDEKGLSNIVTFYPATKELHKAMRAADVVALFSFFEGLPNTVCEGMALGKPILASNISDLPLMISKDFNGYLCEPDDPITIAEGIRYFLNASAEDLKLWGSNSRQRALELFDKEKIVEAYESLIG